MTQTSAYGDQFRRVRQCVSHWFAQRARSQRGLRTPVSVHALDGGVSAAPDQAIHTYRQLRGAGAVDHRFQSTAGRILRPHTLSDLMP